MIYRIKTSRRLSLLKKRSNLDCETIFSFQVPLTFFPETFCEKVCMWKEKQICYEEWQYNSPAKKNALKIDQFIEIIRNFTHYQIGEKMMDFLDFFTSISKHGLKDPASHTSEAIFSYEWIISDFGISELLQIVVDFIRNPSIRKWHQSEKDFRNCQGLFPSFFYLPKKHILPEKGA